MGKQDRFTDEFKRAAVAQVVNRGYRKLHNDLCDLGEDISPNRAWRLARMAGIRAQIGYKKRPGASGGSPAAVDAPDQFWVTDITYIRTHEGFLYLAVVIDLFSRRVIGPLSRFAGKPLPGSGPGVPVHQLRVAGVP